MSAFQHTVAALGSQLLLAFSTVALAADVPPSLDAVHQRGAAQLARMTLDDKVSQPIHILDAAVITSLQAPDAQRSDVITTPKHLAVHSGPEHSRHWVNVGVSLRDLSFVNAAGERRLMRGRYTLSVGGGQPGAGVQAVAASLELRTNDAWSR